MFSNVKKHQFLLFLFICILFIFSFAKNDVTKEYNDVILLHHVAEESNYIELYGKAKQPLITLNFRANSHVHENIRLGVTKAISDLERVSCGLAKVNVIWDYDQYEILIKATINGENIIKNISVNDVQKLGRDDSDVLLGLTQIMQSPKWNAVWIFLVNDRLENNLLLTEWTVLHEFGHAIGMDHVQNGLMEPHPPRSFDVSEKPSWSLEDKEEFCKIYKCDPQLFNHCLVK